MLSSLIRFAIEQRAVVLVAAAVLTGFGIYRLAGAGLDIFPEFAPKLVVVQTEAPGFSAEEVETRVTQVLEAALGGLIDLDHIRSESIQGLSIVTVVFAERSDTWRNRAQVGERLAQARARLPVGVGEPVIAPLASSSATVRTIGLTATDADLAALRDVVNTVVVPRLLGVAGVADINVFGGLERALVITPDSAALARHGLALDEFAQALSGLGLRPGLGVIETANQQLALTSATDGLDPATLAALSLEPLSPLTVGELATVAAGALPRISAAQIMGQPGVVLMIIGQLGANTLTVSNALEQALADLAPVLAARGYTLHERLFVPATHQRGDRRYPPSSRRGWCAGAAGAAGGARRLAQCPHCGPRHPVVAADRRRRVGELRGQPQCAGDRRAGHCPRRGGGRRHHRHREHPSSAAHGAGRCRFRRRRAGRLAGGARLGGLRDLHRSARVRAAADPHRGQRPPVRAARPGLHPRGDGLARRRSHGDARAVREFPRSASHRGAGFPRHRASTGAW